MTESDTIRPSGENIELEAEIRVILAVPIRSNVRRILPIPSSVIDEAEKNAQEGGELPMKYKPESKV